MSRATQRRGGAGTRRPWTSAGAGRTSAACRVCRSCNVIILSVEFLRFIPWISQTFEGVLTARFQVHRNLTARFQVHLSVFSGPQIEHFQDPKFLKMKGACSWSFLRWWIFSFGFLSETKSGILISSDLILITAPRSILCIFFLVRENFIVHIIEYHITAWKTKQVS